MSADAMLNVRLEKELKDHGCDVLDRCGISVSEFVRGVFKHLEKTQALPAEIFSQPENVCDSRRRLVRSVVGAYPVEEGFDFQAAREEYRAHRGEKFEAGVRE